MSKQAQLDRKAEAGQTLLVELYVGRDYDTLNGLRFQLFIKSLMKDNFNFSSLSPTLESVREHCLRTYLQIQMWLCQLINPLMGLANYQTWSGSNYLHQRSSNTVAFHGNILKMYQKM
ncbi:hypothetical protein AVEN_231623-1 [Araneus ventricosus]|uniref:Uncharacterized protein n=1 Tax=Araneus ventricosus TaxID=182803 RepID=A0A4Y2QSU1_ARAVE|nr:hypothetical protein AVEN_231623-1 [Araneus ventricosus]